MRVPFRPKRHFLVVKYTRGVCQRCIAAIVLIVNCGFAHNPVLKIINGYISYNVVLLYAYYKQGILFSYVYVKEFSVLQFFRRNKLILCSDPVFIYDIHIIILISRKYFVVRRIGNEHMFYNRRFVIIIYTYNI